MINNRTITVMQMSNADTLLIAYRHYIGNENADKNALYVFITTPTPEREEFLAAHCTCSYSTTNNIVISTYTAL